MANAKTAGIRLSRSAVLALAKVALPQPALPFSLWESRSLGSGEGF